MAIVKVKFFNAEVIKQGNINIDAIPGQTYTFSKREYDTMKGIGVKMEVMDKAALVSEEKQTIDEQLSSLQNDRTAKMNEVSSLDATIERLQKQSEKASEEMKGLTEADASAKLQDIADTEKAKSVPANTPKRVEMAGDNKK